MNYALTNCEVFTGEKTLYNKSIIIQGNRIAEITDEDKIPSDIKVIDLGGLNVAPGFIDLQVNGGGGEFFTNNPTPDCLKGMFKAYKRYGTTHFLPTIITSGHDTIMKALDAVEECLNQYGVLGMHLEGPFLSSKKKGTHSAEHIRPATPEELHKILEKGNNLIKILTCAPEELQEDARQILKDSKMIISAGHSFATYEEAKKAFNEDGGFTMVTHLFNAMSQFNSREPGLVGATFDSDNVWAGIIVDGLHCDYSSVRTAKKILGEKLFIVSDAMSFVGGNTNTLIIDGTEITFKNGRCINTNGDFAGTSITMLDAIKNAVNHVGIELNEALRMASTYPAKAIGVDDCLGKIDKGYLANLAIFDNRLEVKGIVCDGEYETF